METVKCIDCGRNTPKPSAGKHRCGSCWSKITVNPSPQEETELLKNYEDFLQRSLEAYRKYKTKS